MKKRIPHGLSNYKDIITENYFYVDRTMYIEKMEQVPNKYQFLLRPRKFGKSLFVSMLQYYYGIEYKELFQELFGEYYIGKNPTPLANSYYVLTFDFSGIKTNGDIAVVNSFRTSILGSIDEFIRKYDLLYEKDILEIKQANEPADVLVTFFRKLTATHSLKIMIVIDEYDHFTNELLALNLDFFKSSVASNGFVRKFFEVIKTFTGTGLVSRMFATGVTPVTLDSLTSGFNIAKNLSLDEEFNEIMGFEEQEVAKLLEYYEIQNSDIVLSDMRGYYNGSCFSPGAEKKLYNSNMVLYFLDEINRKQKYPRTLIDVNIASDYSKIANIFRLVPGEESEDKITEIIENGETASTITEQFSFERVFNINDIVSLLFYNGLLTIKGKDFGNTVFTIPNYVIRELYWKFFADRFERESQIRVDSSQLNNALKQMALEGKIDLYMGIINNMMKQLSNRDLQRFDEKYIKMLFVAFASLSPIYYKKSEYEANKKYPDLLFLSTPIVPVENQMLFEFKYVKVSESHRLEEKLAEATAQIQSYLELEEIKQIKNLHSYAIVFVGEVGHWSEVRGI